MGEQHYFVINSSEGDVRVTILTKAELETRLNEEGSGYEVLSLADITKDRYSHDLTASGGTLIIKGALIVPKPIKVVERLAID